MATTLQHKGSQREYIIFTLLASIIIGYFSIISDHLFPILSGGNAESLMVKIWVFLAVILNDFAMWLLLTTLIGWRYGTKLHVAIFRGILFAVFAIGGAVGGAMGYFAQKWPLILPRWQRWRCSA